MASVVPPPVTRVRIDQLEVDAAIRQEHVADADVTEHPVEQGADPADHSRRKSNVLTLEIIQSSTPLTTTFTESSPAPDGLASRVREADAYLLNAIDTGRLLEVTTALRKYANMVVTSYRATRDAKTGDCLSATVSFKQIRLVSNLLEIPTDDLRGKGRKNLGKQPAGKTAGEPSSTTLHDWLIAPYETAH